MWKSKHNTIILIILLILSFAYNTNAFFFYLNDSEVQME